MLLGISFQISSLPLFWDCVKSEPFLLTVLDSYNKKTGMARRARPARSYGQGISWKLAYYALWVVIPKRTVISLT